MNKLLKRYLSIALALVLVLCAVPMTAFAEDEEVPELPTAMVTNVEDESLTFALNITPDQATNEQFLYYGGWYADIELTANKDVYFHSSEESDGKLLFLEQLMDGVTLEANQSLKLLEYANGALGNPYHQFTYGNVESELGIDTFTCGAFFTEAFLKANPDLRVTVELKMYNPENLSECYVLGGTYRYPDMEELPTATVTRVNNENLTFALNFKADPVTEKQLAYFGNWFADFEIKANKDLVLNAAGIENGTADGYLSGNYGEYGWKNVPIQQVIVKAGEPIKIMETAAEQLNEPGLKYTYKEVYEVVKNFDCGLFLTEEFLAKNPDFEVTLELKLYNPMKETESYSIGEIEEFAAIEALLPTATATKIKNDNLTFAMNFKVDEITDEQFAYYKNWYADFELVVNKNVTLNANGTADGHLSGQYDKWSMNWVNVPTSDVTLKANEPLKIMEYAAELMGEPGLKYTFGEVYTSVQDFDCGMYFTPEFLAENPDLIVELKLRMYNPANEAEGYTIGENYIFKTSNVMPNLPTATVTDIENEDLTFAMNFDVDAVTPEQLAYYDKWFADFELTINKDVTFDANGGKDGHLAGQYDEWSLSWVKVPTSPVQIKANEPLKIMAFAAEFLDEPGLKYTFGEVYSVVKNFDCGIYFTPEFLAANPDLKVTLELKMYNPVDENENYVVGETYIFTTNAVAMNTKTGKVYVDVQEGLNDAKLWQTVILLKNVETSQVLVPESVTLDLNGYELKTGYVSSFGDIVDNSESNEGLLIVPATRVLMQKTNKQLPVKDGEGYRFFEVTIPNMRLLDGPKFVFQPFIEPSAHALLQQGKDAAGVTINVRLTWEKSNGKGSQDFEYVDEKVSGYLGSHNTETGKYGQMFTLSVRNAENYDNLTYEVVVMSKDLGVEITRVCD